MKIIKNTTTINFLNMSKYTFVFSLLLLIGGLFSIFYKGINLSIDFKGGTIINLEIYVKMNHADKCIDLKPRKEK